MNENDEQIPVRKRGRPMRAINLCDCLKNTVRCVKCGACPKFDGKISYCPILAKPTTVQSDGCRYGQVLINAAKQAERRAK